MHVLIGSNKNSLGNNYSYLVTIQVQVLEVQIHVLQIGT